MPLRARSAPHTHVPYDYENSRGETPQQASLGHASTKKSNSAETPTETAQMGTSNFSISYYALTRWRGEHSMLGSGASNLFLGSFDNRRH